MQTDRISIQNIDQSFNLPVEDTTVKALTVIKAAKGPITPVYIPAGSSDLIYEYFGYTSAAYPHVQDVLDYNREFGIYVSAPYNLDAANAVPVAYVTPAGIFKKHTPVLIGNTTVLENIKADGLSIEGLSSFTSDVDVLIPMTSDALILGYPDKYNTAVAMTNTAISYTGGIKFQFGFSAGTGGDTEFANVAGSALQWINEVAHNLTTGKIFKRPSMTNNAGTEIGIITCEIPGEAALDIYVVIDTDVIQLRTPTGELIVEIDSNPAVSAITIPTTNAGFAGTGKYATYFAPTAIASWWAVSANFNSVRWYWKATLDKDAIAAVFYPKYLSAAETTLSFAKQTLSNKITFTVSELVTPTLTASHTYSGSIVPTDTDGFGQSLDLSEKLGNQGLIEFISIEPFTNTTVFTATGTTTGPNVTLPGLVLDRGVRTAATDTDAAWTTVYNAVDSLYSDVDIFFAPEDLHTASPDSDFFSIAGTQPLTRCVSPIEITDSSTIVDGMTKLTSGYNYWFTTNKFVRKSTYTKEEYYSFLTGTYCLMIARCIRDKFGGVAPMFMNEAGLGGQLPVTVLRAVYNYNKTQQRYLDDANYNPIIKDPSLGIMVTSQKTAKEGELSDWSYIGHVSAFIDFQKEMYNGPMFEQIGKPNNYEYQHLRDTQIRSILSPRISGANKIWNAAIVDTVACNTDEIKAQRKFKIVVKVKVDIFSEGVDLVFINVGQTTTLA